MCSHTTFNTYVKEQNIKSHFIQWIYISWILSWEASSDMIIMFSPFSCIRGLEFIHSVTKKVSSRIRLEEYVSLHFFAVTTSVILIFFLCLCWFLVPNIVFEHRRFEMNTINSHASEHIQTFRRYYNESFNNRKWKLLKWLRLMPVSNFTKQTSVCFKFKLVLLLDSSLIIFLKHEGKENLT